MSKAAVSKQESDSAINVAKTNTLHPRSSSSFFPSTLPPLVAGSHSISNTTKPLVQPKLKIGAPNDKYEQEADRVADQVMCMPNPGAVQPQTSTPHIQRLCLECENELQRQQQSTHFQINPVTNTIRPLVQRQEVPEEEEEMIPPEFDQEPQESAPILDSVPTRDADELVEGEESMPILESLPTNDASELAEEGELSPPRESVPGGIGDELWEEEDEELIQPKNTTSVMPQVTPGIAHNINSIKGGGQPLPATERAFFEPRFGRDFSHVRVHAHSRAALTAQSINARAFTLGHNVVFGAGQYAPGTNSSRRLLAHELTHVVQQGAAARVTHTESSWQREAPVPQQVGDALRDGTDVVRMNIWKTLQDIKGKGDELTGVLGQADVADDLYKELNNPKPTRREKWAIVLIRFWKRRLAQNKKTLLYAGTGSIATYSRIIKMKDPVNALMDESDNYKLWARNNLREQKRSSRLKLKYRKASIIVNRLKKLNLGLYGWSQDLKYFILALRFHRLKNKYSHLYIIHKERARVLAQTVRIQKNIAKIFDKASAKYDKKLSPPPKRSRSGTHKPSIIDVLKGLSRIF